MAKRNLYLSNAPVEEALSRFMSALGLGGASRESGAQEGGAAEICAWDGGAQKGGLRPRSEAVPVPEALGRVTAGAVYARLCSPPYCAAAMDGIAVTAASTAGAGETTPLRLALGRDFAQVDTGDPIRPPFDAVIMAEDVQEDEDDGDGSASGDCAGRPKTAVIREAAAAWQHVRPIGEDIVAGEMILPGRHRIRAIDIGVLLSAGITEAEVLRRPCVAIFPTGGELVEPGQAPGEGQIVESNSRMLEALAKEAGCEARRFAPIPDDPALLESALGAALAQFDMLLVNAGSSAGTEDYTAAALARLGRVIVHGVAMKPGKPVILAVAQGKPAIGIPGYPVSAYLAFRAFAAPVLAALSGAPASCAAESADCASEPESLAAESANCASEPENRAAAPADCASEPESFAGEAAACASVPAIRAADPALPSPPGGGGAGGFEATATMAKRLVSSLKHREYARVKVGSVDGRLVASPLARGAGAAMSLVRADGFCVIPQNSEGIEAGQPARIELCRPLGEIERSLVCVGSHDLILDVIADMMSPGGHALSGAHVGSAAGLMALKRGECHVAPIHLLDEESGAYNAPHLRRLFPGEPVALMKGVGRTQGLIVQKGNPLGLRSLEDLAARESPPRFVSRQRGSGTRLFLDFRLRMAGIPPERVNGYDREAATHMAVAAAVQSGSADAGMGIASAAAAMGLGFIPLGAEEYDFAVRPRHTALPQFRLFAETLKSARFRRRLGELGGYTWERCGEMAEISPGA